MRLSVLLMAVTLSAASCADSDDAADGTAATTGSTAEAPETTGPDTTVPDTTTTTTEAVTTTVADTTTEVPAATDPPATDAPATDPPAEARAGDCLVGEWVVTQDELNGFYDVVEASVDGLVLEIVGDAGLTFTENEYVWLPQFQLTIVVAGLEGNGVAGGSISGTYTTDGDIITTTLVSSDMTMEIDMGGTVMDASAIGNDFMTTVPIQDAPYSCDTGVPVIGFETGDGTPRHPVTLTPAA